MSDSNNAKFEIFIESIIVNFFIVHYALPIEKQILWPLIELGQEILKNVARKSKKIVKTFEFWCLVDASISDIFTEFISKALRLGRILNLVATFLVAH